MAACRSLTDDRDEMQADLDAALRQHQRVTFNANRLERDGADPEYVARLRDQAAAGRRWIDRIAARLAA